VQDTGAEGIGHVSILTHPNALTPVPGVRAEVPRVPADAPPAFTRGRRRARTTAPRAPTERREDPRPRDGWWKRERHRDTRRRRRRHRRWSGRTVQRLSPAAHGF